MHIHFNGRTNERKEGCRDSASVLDQNTSCEMNFYGNIAGSLIRKIASLPFSEQAAVLEAELRLFAGYLDEETRKRQTK